MQRPLAPLLTLAAATLFIGRLDAQLRQPGQPASETASLAEEIPLVVLPPPDVVALKAEDEARGHWPYRYGAVLSTALDLDTAGRWDRIDGGGPFVWRLRIASPGAHSLGVVFDRYELSAGERVFLYDPERAQVLGAYTERNNKPNGMLAVQPLAGDQLVIEYVQEPWVTTRPRLRIGEVIHGYRDVLAGTPPNGRIEMSCFVDANCPAGDPYQDIKRAVVELLAGGTQCSGALLNDTAEDETPYLLTANHCGSMTNAVVVFNYELSGCGTGPSSQSQTVSGATKLAGSSVWDSQLYRLTQPVPDSYEPFYAGWARGNGPVAPGIGLSHPQGMPKKIAIDNSAPGRSGKFWTARWNTGMVHGGSSGSPLFSGRKRVIGPACCVTNFSCGTQQALYGRFGGFWNARNLGQWLDPAGLDPNVFDGLDPFHAQALPYNGARVNPDVYTSTTTPGLGTTWIADIDTSGHPGAVFTVIVAYEGKLTGLFFGFGELLVDFGSAFHTQSLASVSGGLSTHANPVPNSPFLVGLVSYTQAAILGGGAQATNAVKLRLNVP